MMLTCGIISKYFLKCFGHIIIQPKLFISIGHDDDPWQSIEALKDLWRSNFPQEHISPKKKDKCQLKDLHPKQMCNNEN
jgi:hypothetical protein